MSRQKTVPIVATPTKTVAYIRVSTEGQNESGLGLEVQRDAILAYAAFHQIEVAEWFRDVESGAKEQREGLIALRTAAQSGAIAQVLMYKMDRIARDVLLSETIYRELTQAAVRVVSVSEAFDDSPAGQLMRTILSAFAAYERATITLRTSSGRKARVSREGTHHGGPPAFGYRAVGSRTQPGHGVLEIDDVQAAAVRRAFALLDGTRMTFTQIASALNADGYRTARAVLFTGKQVRRMLDRRAVYAGLLPTAPSVALNAGVVPAHPAILASAARQR